LKKTKRLRLLNVAFPPEPELKWKKTEVKGGLAELQKRGIRIKNYTESKG
jgi:hypothetical protein